MPIATTRDHGIVIRVSDQCARSIIHRVLLADQIERPRSAAAGEATAPSPAPWPHRRWPTRAVRNGRPRQPGKSRRFSSIVACSSAALIGAIQIFLGFHCERARPAREASFAVIPRGDGIHDRTAPRAILPLTPQGAIRRRSISPAVAERSNRCSPKRPELDHHFASRGATGAQARSSARVAAASCCCNAEVLQAAGRRCWMEILQARRCAIAQAMRRCCEEVISRVSADRVIARSDCSFFREAL